MESERPDLAKLEELAKAALERANAATKGPWHFHEGDLVNIDHQDVLVDWEEAYGPNENELGPDAKFVLAARQDVPELAAAVLQWIAYARFIEEQNENNRDDALRLHREKMDYFDEVVRLRAELVALKVKP